MSTKIKTTSVNAMDEEPKDPTRGQSRVAGFIIGLVLLVITLMVAFPFYDVLIVSFGTPAGSIFPTTFNFSSYSWILGHSGVLRAFLTSVGIVAVGTPISLIMTACTAYALSRKHLVGRNIISAIIIITMFFGGGLVPWYILCRDLGLINSYWAMILPSAMNAFYMLIMLTFFREFPDSLEESARIDGANDWAILFKIVLPTSGPVMATIGLFYADARWNDWFTPMVLLPDPAKWPLQTFTQQLLINAQQILQYSSGASSALSQQIPVLTDSLQMAVIVIGVLPIMLVYPFLQKYFAKGVMIGSVKG